MEIGDYSGSTIASDENQPHLGGNVRQGDPFTFSPRVWSYVIERFCISSVLDLGSGAGHAAEFFFRKGIRTIAVDGLLENVDGSVYPAICHDLTSGAFVTKVDLVHLSGGCRAHRRTIRRTLAEQPRMWSCDSDDTCVTWAAGISSCEPAAHGVLGEVGIRSRLQSARRGHKSYS